MMFFQRNSEFAVVDFQAKYKTYVGKTITSTSLFTLIAERLQN